MALSADELALIEKHRELLARTRTRDDLMGRYYRGRQRVEQLGMAIPPDMRRFLVVANWCRTFVDVKSDRQQMRAWMMPGADMSDPVLREVYEWSNVPAAVRMFNTDRMVFGRGFMTVDANPDAPLVRTVSPMQISVEADPLTEEVIEAVRLFGPTRTDRSPHRATIFTPEVTVQAERDRGKWVELSRWDNRGVVPVVQHLNRRMSGEIIGESEMSDLIPIVDAAARSLTNMQFAQEAHGIPRMFMTGVAKGDFLDADGKPIPQFEAYFDAIHMLSKADAKVGQLTAADLKNFETAMQVYGKQASLVTGFPARYWGITTVNPPAEGAIYADEGLLVRNVESDNEQVGVSLSRVGAIAYAMATAGALPSRPPRTEWFDPATPTISQREDALSKRRAAGVLSREGYWDELGWSEARKAKEREYLRAEQREMMGFEEPQKDPAAPLTNA